VDGHLGRNLEFYLFISQNGAKNTGMDVLRDNNKLCIVKDIELNGLKTSIEHILKWQKKMLLTCAYSI